MLHLINNISLNLLHLPEEFALEIRFCPISPFPDHVYSLFTDADPDRGICVLRLQWTNSHGPPSPMEEKGQQDHSHKWRAT